MKKQYHILIAIISLLIVPLVSKAQNGCQDTIHLKNGQVVYGKIIDIQKPLYVVIKVNDTAAYMYSWFRVKRVYRCSNENDNLIPAIGLKSIRGSTCFLSFEVEETLIISQIDTNAVNFVSTPKLSFGFNFKREISCGIGAGFFEYNHAGFIPLYGQFKKDFFQGSLAEPFVEGDAGYTVCNGPNGDKGGVNINIRIGAKSPFINKLDLFASFGLGYEQYSFYQSVANDEALQQKSFVVLNLNIGVTIE